VTAAMQAEEAVPDVRQLGRDISIAAGGRFRCGIDQFSLFPSARNVLDLGIFGPAGHSIGNSAGFRGWSGGARDTFTLSATEATPGYLAGPIDPGRWTLCLDPVVLNPFGMRWQATIVLESGEPASSRTSSTRARRTTLRGEKDWYRGDLHLHTVHSDGQYEPPELIAVAHDAGLDFIVSTDHNTSSANRAWDDSAADSPMVIAGEEVTTRHGHWLAIGLPTTGWVDWRYAPRDGLFPYFGGRVRADGGVVVAAHPAVPLPGSTWEFGYADVDAIEVWNGVWNLDDEVSLRIWQSLLRRGRRIVAVGGSDSHGSHQRIGSPQTVIRVANPSQAALLEALRRGNSYIAESGAVSVDLRAWRDDSGTRMCACHRQSNGQRRTRLQRRTDYRRRMRGAGSH
jgi:hypothetical protein